MFAIWYFLSEELLVSENELGGTIPQEIGHLTDLSKDIAGNMLTNSFSQINLKSSWFYMFVFDPFILGPIDIVRLDLSKNLISGTIPGTIGSLSGIGESHLL
jgi:hypothetical protein